MILDLLLLGRQLASPNNDSVYIVLHKEGNLEGYLNKCFDIQSFPKFKEKKFNRLSFHLYMLDEDKLSAGLESIQPSIQGREGGNVSLSDFNFLKMLGIGGFSKVYLVEMKKNNELFALKYVKLDGEKIK